MNTNSLRSKLGRLKPANQKKFLDYLVYLTWTERPFRDVVNLSQEIDRRLTSPSWRAPGLLTDLYYCGRILRGVWMDIREFGLTEAWLRIAGLYR